MQRLLYLASLPHSGSTLFTLMMGHHQQMIGLGGIDRAVRMIMTDRQATGERNCTCGALARDCPYWGAVFEELTRASPQSLVERYRVALSVFARVFGDETWPIDAGQVTEPLFTLAQGKWLDLRVIHLARDVRSAIISEIDARRRRERARQWPLVTASVMALRWRRENEKIDECREQARLPGKNFGYEELCLGLQQTFDLVCEFLGLEKTSTSDQVPRTRSHLFIGNRMRMQDEKASLRYDGRWLSRSEWVLPSVLLPFVLRRNRDWVYGNNIFAVFTRQ